MTTDEAASHRRGRGGRRDPRTVALLGVGELAERLGTTERFVRRLVAERRVPFHKVGKYVRFDPKDIDDWLVERRVEAVS
jgi:excisionase family DNA binding protein